MAILYVNKGKHTMSKQQYQTQSILLNYFQLIPHIFNKSLFFPSQTFSQIINQFPKYSLAKDLFLIQKRVYSFIFESVVNYQFELLNGREPTEILGDCATIRIPTQPPRAQRVAPRPARLQHQGITLVRLLPMHHRHPQHLQGLPRLHLRYLRQVRNASARPLRQRSHAEREEHPPPAARGLPAGEEDEPGGHRRCFPAAAGEESSELERAAQGGRAGDHDHYGGELLLPQDHRSAELSCDKAAPVAEIAIKLLAAMVAGVGGGLTNLNPSTLQTLMKGLSLLIQGKRNNLRTNALDICLFIFNQIGSENFLQLLNYALSQSQVQAIGQAMESHRVQKQKAPQLADVLRQHKNQQVMNRQGAQWNQNIR